jgi:protein-disulfide isomerase
MRLNRLPLLALATLALLLMPGRISAQNTTRVNDPSFLRPPAGAKVAVIEFEDLECPSCSRFAPIVHAAASRYKVPLLRHDFPLPMHTWAYDAAVDARWFEYHSPALGDEYRARIFSNQAAIYTKNDLLGFTQRFAREKGLAWPFVIDPQGLLRAKVERDIALGKNKVVIDHTPSIWVVTHGRYVEIKTPDEVDAAIRKALAETSGK